MSAVVYLEIRAASLGEAKRKAQLLAAEDAIKASQAVAHWDDSDATCVRLLAWLHRPAPEVAR